MFVYFLRVKQGPLLMKIGKAKDPLARVRTLQTGCPLKITLIAALQCKDDAHALRVEKALHEYFGRNRRDGEWFLCSIRVRRRMQKVMDSLDAIAGCPVRVLTERELQAYRA